MERYVAFAGVSGTGCIAEFCSLKEAREFIEQTDNACLISEKQLKSKKFKDDDNEGHRYCSCVALEDEKKYS